MANELGDPQIELEEDGGPVKSFLEHLEDLRWVVIKAGAALMLGMVVCLVAAPFMVDILEMPLRNSGAKDIRLENFNPLGGVLVSMKIALYGGVVLALPFILYFIGDFILPALKPSEKKYFVWAFVIGGGLFVAGVLLCYFFVLSIALYGMAQYNAWLGIPSQVWRVEEYFRFVITFMMGMGLSFEVPVLLLTLVKLEILSHETLTKGRRYFFVGNLVLCAFITPDFISTFFMVIPVQILLEICILISAYWDRQKKAAAAAALLPGSGTASS